MSSVFKVGLPRVVPHDVGEYVAELLVERRGGLDAQRSGVVGRGARYAVRGLEEHNVFLLVAVEGRLDVDVAVDAAQSLTHRRPP